MSRQERIERTSTSRKDEEAQELPTREVGAKAVQAAEAASQEVETIDKAIEDAESQNVDLEKLMADIDELFEKESAEQMVAEFVQKGGE